VGTSLQSRSSTLEARPRSSRPVSIIAHDPPATISLSHRVHRETALGRSPPRYRLEASPSDFVGITRPVRPRQRRSSTAIRLRGAVFRRSEPPNRFSRTPVILIAVSLSVSCRRALAFNVYRCKDRLPLQPRAVDRRPDTNVVHRSTCAAGNSEADPKAASEDFAVVELESFAASANTRRDQEDWQ